MLPVVFRIPVIGWDVPGYGLMLMIGFLVSIMWAARRALRSGANPDVVLNCGFIALIAGIVGARAMYVIHYWELFGYRGNWIAVVIGILDVRKGGLEVYGGFIATTVSVLVYLIGWGHSVRWYLDIVAPSTALGMAFGRVGCFLNGCCWGGICDLPWNVQFPFGSNAAVTQFDKHAAELDFPKELIFDAPGVHEPLAREALRQDDADVAKARGILAPVMPSATDLYGRIRTTKQKDVAGRDALVLEFERLVGARDKLWVIDYVPVVAQLERYKLDSPERLRELARHGHSLGVHPTQLYAAINLGLLAALLGTLYWRRTRDGQVVCTLLLIEPISRWLLEIVRADNPQDVRGLLTISQALAIGLSACGLLGFFALRALPPRSRKATLWEPPVEAQPVGRSAKKAAAASGTTV